MKNTLTTPEERALFYRHLKVFGDAWMLIIVCELLRESQRFNELNRRIASISPVTLAARLKKLEALGIVRRTVQLSDGVSVHYNLTEKGRALEPVLREIRAFCGEYIGVLPVQCANMLSANTIRI